MANNEDSDDEYVAKDTRSKSEVLKDCKLKFVNCSEAQKLAKLIVKELTVVIVLMRMCDSDKLWQRWQALDSLAWCTRIAGEVVWCFN